MNTRIWARTESGNLWHAFTEDGEGPALCHSRIWARMFARMNDDFRTREGAESPLTTRCERCVAKFEALLAEATVEHTPAPAEAAEKAVDGPTFTEQAGVRYAVIGKGKRVHYSPSNDDGLCGRAITAYLDVEDAVALFDKGYELCAPCHRAAEQRAEARRLAAASPLAAAAAEVAETVETADAEAEATARNLSPKMRAILPAVAAAGSWRTTAGLAELPKGVTDPSLQALIRRGLVEEFETGETATDFQGQPYKVKHHRISPKGQAALRVLDAEREAALDRLAAEVTQLHTEADTLLADTRETAAEADQLANEVDAWGAEVDAITEQRVVEGVIVEHAGTAKGSTPSNASHPDVAAARVALDQLKAADITDHHDVTEPTDAERSVRGYLIDPRTQGRIAVYWLEGGRIIRRDDPWHGPALDILADRLRSRGWAVERMLRSSQCVFAHRPDEDAAPAQAQPAALAELPTADTLCLHGQRPRPDVSGDPITWCARKQPNQSAGVFNDEGCVLAVDCCVEAANDCAQYNVEAEAPAGDPKFSWALMCTEHDEQTADTCEECNAIPAEDRCKECAGKGCHWCHWTGEQQPEQAEADNEKGAAEAELLDTVDAVEKAERVDGTWRGGWIASAPADGALFDLGPDEQGALFT
ncbi:hypothetical protein [Streptomyces noursei]|uniref:hypothetical protein n=1 Tax=Streptomyces noursei TaxID=1971 RepID=UPI00196682F2|nr:hypothetical protein [Streptomyces noursei]QRX93384.1 hypothetical protein JNO44_23225 [Streptomyces noursei]